MKKAIILISLISSISTQYSYANQNTVSDAYLLFNITNNNPSIELAVLSPEEMKNTEGAFWQYGLGGLAGMYGSGYGYLIGGGSNPWGFLAAAATGFTAGVWSPINGFRSGLTTLGSGLSAGIVGGYGSSVGWW